MKVTLIMIFWLKNGKTMNLYIPYPRKDLTEAEVRSAVFELLARKVIISDDGIMATALKHVYLRRIVEELLP